MAIKRAHGIDISFWQEKLVPRPQNNADIDFVILKASQSNFSDPNFEDYYTASQSFPLRGAYHYFHTITTFSSRIAQVPVRLNKPKEQEKKGGAKAIVKEINRLQTFTENGPGWKEQADFFLSQVQGKEFHFFALDVEKGRDPKEKAGRTQNVFTREDVVNIKRWIEYVKSETGKTVLLYTNQDIYKSLLLPNGGQILADLDLWLAGYPFTPNRDEDDPLGIYKIPGVKKWNFWQYSADGNMKGKDFGVRSASIDLNVFNGTLEDMVNWLKIEPAEIKTPVRPQEKAPEIPGIPVRKPVERPMQETKEQLEKIKQAGLTPIVQIHIHQDELDLEWINSFKEILKDPGIQVEIVVDVQRSLGDGGGESAGSASRPSHRPDVRPEMTHPTKPVSEKPEIIAEEESFTVVVMAEKSVVQGFKQRDKAGKPIMLPHDPRIILLKGARLKVSTSHKESDKDAGDGTIRGTGEGKLYYFITEYAADPSAKGLFVKQEDVRRV